MNIDSKLHRALELLCEGSSRIAASFDFVTSADTTPEYTLLLLDTMQKLPRFYFSSELLGYLDKKEVHQSMVDMQAAGVLRLPFPEVVVEYQNVHGQNFICYLREDKENDKQFICYVLLLTKARQGHEVLVRPPGFFKSRFVTQSEKVALMLTDGVDYVHDGVADAMIVVGHQFFNSAKLPSADQQTIDKFSTALGTAMGLATVMIQTLGLRRDEVHEPRLNRARVSKGKVPITPYTRISIGKVYRGDSERSDDYVPGKSPRPHWRRGHARRYHYGTGRTETRVLWIPARMVAMASAPEYRVTK